MHQAPEYLRGPVGVTEATGMRPVELSEEAFDKADGGAPPGGAPQPAPPETPAPKPKPPAAKPVYGVPTQTLPGTFAPSAEQIGSYVINDAEQAAPSGKLELFRTVGGAMVEDKPLWQRALSPSERSHGQHSLSWDGKISGHTGGSDFPGDWLSVEFSPYKLRITLTGGSPEKQEATFKVEVASIDMTVADAASNKVLMNDPNRKLDVIAQVKLKKSDGSAVLTQVPVRLTYTFSDPGGNNTPKAGSFMYQAPAKNLGKAGDAAALHFEARSGSPATSADGFKTQCLVQAIGTAGADQGKAKVWFKPSGVGGDDFKIKAAAMHSNGSELLAKESDAVAVWRAVAFNNIYEMQGETHVSTNGTTAIIAPVFDPAFVTYSAGTPTAIDATRSVKYIGLWGGTGTPQHAWATVRAKTAAETPSAAEITDALYAGADPALLAKQATARAAILAKAQAWTNRIDTAFHTSMNAWISDAGIPSNALVSIKHYHPKYSPSGGDSQTHEWNLGGGGTPAWLRVGAFSNGTGGHFYTGLDPDANWTSWGGLSHGAGRVTVPTGSAAATVKQVVRHEAGHATKSFFKRDVFGPSLDHSVSQAGIMYYTTAGGTTFTDREKKILRGIVP